MRRDPRALVDLLLAPCTPRPGRLSACRRLQSLTMRRRIRSAAFPCTVTRCPSSRWTGCWSRSRTTSPSSCASTHGPHRLLPAPARTHDLVGAGGQPAWCSCWRAVYQRRWRYSASATTRRSRARWSAIVLLTVVGGRGRSARCRPLPQHRTAAVGLPNGVIVLFVLLALVFLRRRARARAQRLRAPAAGGVPRRAQGRAQRADRRRRRRRAAGAARDRAQPRARPDAGRLRRRRPAQARPADRRRAACAATPKRDLPRVLDDAEPDEVIIAIPSAPGSMRARIVRECRTRGHPRAHAADGLRAAADARGARGAPGARGAVEDVLGREPVRMELERVGAYLAGEVVLVTGAGGSIGAELCRQIARVGAAPARAARPRRGQPLRDPARAGGRAPRAARRCSRRCSPTARRRSACARSSPSTARRSSSTPPPTSTSG